MLEILFWVLMVVWLVMQPWPGAPWASWPWAASIVPWLLFLCLGITVYGFHARL